jgi:CelD/BcsL family acetyltransferase involved in cellulose biosynthesis
MEYNGFLSEKGMGADVAKYALTWLADNEASWDELYLSGLDPATRGACEDAASAADLKLRIRYEKPSAHVDLDGIRHKGGDYLSVLSRNTRHQLRRSLRLYEKQGPVNIRVASSTEEGLNLFNELKVHHQTTWTLRGKLGSFANPFFEQFHRRLIEERCDKGEIQLAHITSAKKTIGVLYNFLWRGVVYSYQSGFNYEDDPKRKPGLISHYMAVRHNLSTDARIYDFMAGQAQHKTSLSTDATSVVWLVVQRDRFKYQLEDLARSLKGVITRNL